MDSEQSEASGLVVEFVIAVTTAMGLTLQAEVTETEQLLRVNLSGEGAEWLVRRRGETLNALQHIVATVFRDSVSEDQRVVVDCLGFRQDKDAEIRKMAHFMADKAVSSGTAQEIGAAQSLRAPHRAHGRGRARRRDVGEHRRRVHAFAGSFVCRLRRGKRDSGPGRLPAAGQPRPVPLTLAGKTHLRGSFGGRRGPTTRRSSHGRSVTPPGSLAPPKRFAD